MTQVRDVIIDSDERVGDGGFLALRRLRLRNQRADGSVSAQYVCDTVVRPYGQDAVVVVVYARTERGIEVLVRNGLRPQLALGRDPERAPIAEDKPGLFLTELVAGIVEDADRGEEGLRARAAAEVHEEAGFLVDQDSVSLLGAGMFPSPGSLVEKFYFASVEVDPKVQEPLQGDGSPMEEGAQTTWFLLDDAIAACNAGVLVDLKTELGLRRLRDHLRGQERK
ncbi:MAG TPA: NUDIX hydrolase [Kofleriaceae bacterium]|nr:NUDIX hydrolase [Kofleriaceae bacterium]